MILDQYGSPMKFAHGADRDRRRGAQFLDVNHDIDRLIPSWDKRALRSLSSRLYLNMGIPRAAINQKADYSVGEAWRPTYTGESDFEDGKAIEKFLHKKWMPQCDVRGGCFDWLKLLELTSIAIDRDGDAFWLLVKGSDGFPRIQQIQAHRVGSGPDSDGIVSSGEWAGYRISDGVIQTAEGRAVAYRVLTGDMLDGYKDVPAQAMIHIYDPAYQDQSRGLPAFTHALEDLKACLASTSDERVRQMIISRLYLTVFNEAGGPDMDDPMMSMAGSVGDGAGGVMAQSVPGGIVYMTAGAGEKMEQVKHETPGDIWESFQDRMIRMSLTGVCWPYSLVWKPAGQGTAERAEVMKARRSVIRRQKQLTYAARRALAWAYSVFVEASVVPILDHPFSWEFSKPPRLTVDDGREAKMEIEEWRAGLRNTSDITESKLGLTEDEFYTMRAHSIAKRKVIAANVGMSYGVEIDDREMAMLTPNETPQQNTQTQSQDEDSQS